MPRHQVELELPQLVDDRVPGVVPGGVAGHDMGLLSDQVDDPALAFVAPLPANYNYR
jgi:hypothetical protein